MASTTSSRQHHQQSRQTATPQASSPKQTHRRLMSMLSSPSRRSAAGGGSGSSNVSSWDLMYLYDGEVVFATFQVDASIDGGPGIPGQLRVASASLFFSPALTYRPTVRIPLAALAECYEDEDAAPPSSSASAAAVSASSSSAAAAAHHGTDDSEVGGGDSAFASTTQARTTVLAAESPEHFLIRPRSPFSRVRRHSVFRFCFADVSEAGAALGWCRRLGPLAAAIAGRDGGGRGSSSSSAAAAAAADAALASLVRRLQDSVSFSAGDLPPRSEGAASAAASAEGENSSKKRGGGGVGVALGRRVLGRRRKDDNEEENSSSSAAAAAAPANAPPLPFSSSSLTSSSGSRLAFECRALRITPLVSDPGRAAVSPSGDLLFKPAAGGGAGRGSRVLLTLPAASIGALLSREWELRDCALEVFAAQVFDDAYGKEFEEEEEEGAEGGRGRSGGGSKRRSFDYRASFSSRPSPPSSSAAALSSPHLASPLPSPRASPNPSFSAAGGASSPEAVEGGGGGGDRRLRRRRSSLSGNRGGGAPRRLPRSAPPSVFLAFESTQDRDGFAQALLARSNCATFALDPEGSQARALAAESAQSWLSGDISTYAHLLRLNFLSGRSFHDLGKYPVFPWVLSDYESGELDLSLEGKGDGADGCNGNDDGDGDASSSTPSPSHPPVPPPPFRDLSRPVGALGRNPARLLEFRKKYSDLEEMARQTRAMESAAAAAAAAARGGNAEEASNKQKKKKCPPLFACCAALPATLDDGQDSRRSPSPALPPSSFPVLEDLALEPFMYGCHYSTPGYCAFWLLRLHPQLALRLQGGKFDAPDRLFLSLKGAWDSATSAPTDVKELVPQFFWRDPSLYLCPAPPPGGGGGGGGGESSSSSSLRRSDSFSSSSPSSSAPFGVRSDGRAVGDVELPPWAWKAAEAAAAAESGCCGGAKAKEPTSADAAAATADAFSAALESDAVAAALPLWIDLVFGFQSGRGDEALKADNVFHPMTYGGVARAALAEVEEKESSSVEIDGDEAAAAAQRRRAAEALRVQAAEFGRCPEVLFAEPHPRVASFPRVKKKLGIGGALSPLREEEHEEGGKKGKGRSWAGGALRLGRRLRWGGKKEKEKETKNPEEEAAAAAAAEAEREEEVVPVVSASSPSFAEDQASSAAALAASRLAAAAKVASHALSDIDEEEEED